MSAITENQNRFPTSYRVAHLGREVSADFRIVCLWSALGLALTGVFFALGFGAEIGQILAVAA
jgi:hypothetical protein